jgi:hypothetical protein
MALLGEQLDPLDGFCSTSSVFLAFISGCNDFDVMTLFVDGLITQETLLLFRMGSTFGLGGTYCVCNADIGAEDIIYPSL